MKAYSKTDPKDRKIKIVPLEEFWTKERRERRLRELGPVKGEREFLKFMREAMTQQAAVRSERKQQPKVSDNHSRLRVLIFCGFTREHRKILEALVLALVTCDCEIVIASLRPGHGVPRMEYIHKQILECDLIVCDLTHAHSPEGWTYHNTALELGGALLARREDCLIFAESEQQLRAQASSLLGYDIVEHGGNCVRLGREIAMTIGLSCHY